MYKQLLVIIRFHPRNSRGKVIKYSLIIIEQTVHQDQYLSLGSGHYIFASDSSGYFLNNFAAGPKTVESSAGLVELY